MRIPGLCLAALALAGCAPSLLDDYPFPTEDPPPPFDVTVGAGGLRSAVVNATSKTAWVYLDLDADAALGVSEAFSTNKWDLAFRRVDVTINGGPDSPAGVVKVAVLKDVAFESLTQAPESGWLQDGLKPVFADEHGGWYFYDLGKHVVTPRKELVYAVRSSEAKFYKLAFDAYYDAAGTAGRVAIRYQAIAPPAVIP